MKTSTNIKLEALQHISEIAWDEMSLERKLDRIQGILYEMEQILDARSGECLEEPNMRRM